MPKRRGMIPSSERNGHMILRDCRLGTPGWKLVYLNLLAENAAASEAWWHSGSQQDPAATATVVSHDEQSEPKLCKSVGPIDAQSFAHRSSSGALRGQGPTSSAALANIRRMSSCSPAA